MTQLSVIICTHNRAHYLKDALQSMVNQTASNSLFEVIVIDNLI